MGRPKRADVAGCIYHKLNRANRRGNASRGLSDGLTFGQYRFGKRFPNSIGNSLVYDEPGVFGDLPSNGLTGLRNRDPS